MQIPASHQQYFKRKELSADSFFVKEGQVSKYIGYVESGLLRSYQINHKGEQITTNFFQPGAFCGAFYSFYEQQPAFENITSITPVTLQLIGFDTLHALLEDDLEANKFGRKSIEAVCIAKDIRLSKMLKLNAKDRYIWLMESAPIIIEKAPLKYIASYLGMQPESLSRIRKELIS